jgi:hypothetical protein
MPGISNADQGFKQGKRTGKWLHCNGTGWPRPRFLYVGSPGRLFASRIVGQKHLIIIFGSIFGFLLVIGIGYYIGYVSTWEHAKHQPKIGAEPLDMKLVFVVKEIAPGQEIDGSNVEERREVMPTVALDAYSFASEALGRKAKWTLHKGDYVSRHDVQPVAKAKNNG